MLDQETVEPETPQPETTEPEVNDNNYIEYNSKKFKLNIEREHEKIVIKLESINENPTIKYFNNFTLQELGVLDIYFRGAGSLEEAIKLLNDLKEEAIRIENKNEKEIKLIIPFLRRNIEITLKFYDNKSNPLYNSLSERMKQIIDNDEIILGIDLGTTYSAASVMLDDKIIMIENSLGLRTTPSFVSFFGPQEICVGELAKLRPSNEGNIIYNSKRLLGKTLKEKQKDQQIMDNLNFAVTEDKELDKLKIAINFKNYEKNPKEYYPEEISAMILKKIVEDSEYFLSKKLGREIKIRRAVITVPAYFNQKQREATIQAAEIINLKVERTINEPTAASLAYGYKTVQNEQKLIAVIDFGGGTLDITLLQFIKNNKGIYCDIKYSYGDTNFGGEDFDYILIKKCLNDKDFDKNESFSIRLKRACEAAKIKLSSCEETKIILEDYMKDKNINLHLSRKDFEKYCSDNFKMFKTKLKDFLKNCGKNKRDIQEVILIGGSTLMPKIQEIIREVFPNSEIKKHLNQNEAVAQGASILGGILSKLPIVSNLNLLDVTNLSLGIRIIGNKMSTVIKRSTPIPYEHSEIYKTTKDNQTEALIEIYEGENKKTEENTFLGQFMIKNLPKKKARKTEVRVKFDVNNDSILKVTAYDKENEENNFKELEIKKPKGLSDIIENLKKENETIKIIDVKEYDQIKNTILDLEEKVYNSSDVNEKDSLKGEIIEEFGKFIMTTISNIHKEALIFSYIKYYFKKICKDYNNTKIEGNVNSFETVLERILLEIQFYNSELICELIEPFVDLNRIYYTCLFYLINNYYNKIGQMFYDVEALLKKGTHEDIQSALTNLSNIKTIITFALKFYERLDDEGKKFTSHIKNLILDFEPKIEVKEFLIKNENKMNKYNEKDKIKIVNNLIEKYKKCKSAEIKDLNELISISKNIDSNDKDNDKNDKDQIFLNTFKNMPNDDKHKFFYFLENYNPNEDLYTDTNAYDFIYKTEEGKKNLEFLPGLISDFSKKYDEEKNINKKNVYDSILKYLNYLKSKEN